MVQNKASKAHPRAEDYQKMVQNETYREFHARTAIAQNVTYSALPMS